MCCKHVIEERKDVEAGNDEDADIDNVESLYDSNIWDDIINLQAKIVKFYLSEYYFRLTYSYRWTWR